MPRDDFHTALGEVYMAHGRPTLAALAGWSGISKGQLSRLINTRSAWPTVRTVTAVLAGLGADGEETARVLDLHSRYSLPARVIGADRASLTAEIRLLRESIDRLTAALDRRGSNPGS